MAAGVIPDRRAAAPNWKSKHNELLFDVMADFKRLFTPGFKIGLITSGQLLMQVSKTFCILITETTYKGSHALKGIVQL